MRKKRTKTEQQEIQDFHKVAPLVAQELRMLLVCVDELTEKFQRHGYQVQYAMVDNTTDESFEEEDTSQVIINRKI